MKKIALKKYLATSVMAALSLAVTGCGGGSSTGSSASASSGVLLSIGGGSYVDPATGQIDASIGGGDLLDSSGQVLVPVGGGQYLNADTGQMITGSTATPTADIDQQQAEVAAQNQGDRAQNLVNEFQMDYDKALQLTQLADQVKSMTASGAMTDADRMAVENQALGVAQLTSDDVNAAITAAVKNGDTTAIPALTEKAAQNLGMPNDQALSERLLPALGIQE